MKVENILKIKKYKNRRVSYSFVLVLVPFDI